MIFLVGSALVLSWVAGYLLLGGARRVASPKGSSPIPRVSLIVPARDEELNLPRLLASLGSQSLAPHEIIVVDDASKDRTAEIARSMGARVVASRPLPEGWTGKNWACHQGFEASQGELLFFVDADCYFEPEGYVSILEDFPTALSILPFHRIERAYENLSLFFNLIMAAAAGGFGRVGKARLFGQSLVVTRDVYQRAGGHFSVREHVLENFFMSARFDEVGARCVCLAGEGKLAFRMFPAGFAQLLEGWTKAFARGARGTQPAVLALSILWLFGFANAPIALLVACVFASPELFVVGLVGSLMFALQLRFFARKIGNYHEWAFWSYPPFWIFYQAVFARSALLGPQQKTWRGRSL